MDRIEFGLLGPLVVRREGALIPVARGRQTALLATLLLDANHLVSISRLTDVLWGVRPPASARAALHNQVKRLRDSLGATGRDRIRTLVGGYLIQVEPDELDITMMRELTASAREAARHSAWERALAQAARAALLWRGEPLADVESDVLARRIIDLTEIYRQAVEIRLEAEINLGRHAETIGELRRFAADQPFRERSYALLMIALYRCGRQGEAIAVYQDARRLLIGELGCEPGPELRRVHQQILNDDPVLTTPAPAAATAGVSPVPVVPRELPGAIRHFTGRAAELRALTEAIERIGDAKAGAMAISAITGMAGVGKTTLAVHWAHQVSEAFPDGQLYANLRGFDPSGVPVAAETLIRDFLAAFGVRPAQIPPGHEARVALYRTVLATKRVLIVLDNARDADQVRSLLPGSPGCFVLVTSRAGLAGLAATEGAHLLKLDLPSVGEARELLTRRLGASLLAAEPAAAQELIRLCGRLPLALGVVAARAASCPGLSLAALAAELADEAGPLDALDTGTLSSNVRAAFSWSCQGLSHGAARLFRLLGIHPGPDISVAIAASLAELKPRQVRPLLRELAQVGLVAEHMPGRFALHDLIRAYAADEAVGSQDTEGNDGLSRVLEHYLLTGHSAALILYQYRAMIPLPPARAGVVPETFKEFDQALVWFEVEQQGLEAAIATAAAAGLNLYAWQISWTLVDFLHWRGHWNSLISTQNIALAAAYRLNEWAGAAVAHRSLARAYGELGELRHASAHLGWALKLYRRLEDPAGQAYVHLGLGMTLDREKRHSEALDHARQSLSLHQASGNRAGQADALNAIGWCHAQLREFAQAFHHSSQALALHQALRNRIGEAHTWDTLGFIRCHSGEHEVAASCYRSAIRLFQDLGNSHYAAVVLSHLGETYREIGDVGAAQEVWEQALSLFRDLDRAEAADVQVKLDHLMAAGRDAMDASVVTRRVCGPMR